MARRQRLKRLAGDGQRRVMAPRGKWGRELHDLLIEAGFKTQIDAARYLRMSVTILRYWRRGHRRPDAELRGRVRSRLLQRIADRRFRQTRGM